jgi:hypothetical protein
MVNDLVNCKKSEIKELRLPSKLRDRILRAKNYRTDIVAGHLDKMYSDYSESYADHHDVYNDRG